MAKLANADADHGYWWLKTNLLTTSVCKFITKVLYKQTFWHVVKFADFKFEASYITFQRSMGDLILFVVGKQCFQQIFSTWKFVLGFSEGQWSSITKEIGSYTIYLKWCH